MSSRQRLQAGLTRGEARWRRRSNRLRARLETTADPRRRVAAAFDYLAGAVENARSRGYLDRDRATAAVDQAVEAMTTAGDVLLRPSNEGRCEHHEHARP